MSKEGLVRSAVSESHLPILDALKQEYPLTYPRVCGPYGNVLMRLPTVVRTGIPLRLGGDCEHFELEIGIFNPPSSTNFEPDEHTYARYYTGTGDVLYIDGIYPLLWMQGTRPDQPLIEKYREDEIDQALAEKHFLFPFSEDLAKRLSIDLWSGDGIISSDPMKDYHDVRDLIHSSRIFEGIVEVASGDTRDMSTWGAGVARVLQAVGGAALTS